MRITRPFTRAKGPAKGRPPLAPHEKRTHVFEVNVNAPERARLTKLASAVGLPPAVYLRERGLRARLPRAQAIGSLDVETLDAVNKLWLAASRLRKELSPIGNNLNQLAHQANAGRLLEGSVLSALAELSPIVERLRLVDSEAERLLSLVATGEGAKR